MRQEWREVRKRVRFPHQPYAPEIWSTWHTLCSMRPRGRRSAHTKRKKKKNLFIANSAARDVISNVSVAWFNVRAHVTVRRQQKHANEQSSQNAVWVACPLSAWCRKVTVLYVKKYAQLKSGHSPVNSKHHWGLTILCWCLSSSPKSHLTQAGRTHSEHTNQIHRGHGLEKRECHWTQGTTGSPTTIVSDLSIQYCHTVNEKDVINCRKIL